MNRSPDNGIMATLRNVTPYKFNDCHKVLETDKKLYTNRQNVHIKVIEKYIDGQIQPTQKQSLIFKFKCDAII